MLTCKLNLRLNKCFKSSKLAKLSIASLNTSKTLVNLNTNPPNILGRKIYSFNKFSRQNLTHEAKRIEEFYKITSPLRATTIHSRFLHTVQTVRPYIDPSYSYVYGKSNEHLIYSTIAREFNKSFHEKPDEIVYISHYENKQVTFKQLNRDVNKLSKALIEKFDIKHGDFVGVFAYNCYNWIVIQFACSRIGAILVPINPSYKATELSYVLETSMVKCLFMPGPKSVQSKLNNHIEVLHSNEIIQSSKESKLNLTSVILMDNNEYSANNNNNLECKLKNCKIYQWNELENDGLVFNSVQEAEEAGFKESNACILSLDSLSPDDLFAVYYTSGTTGRPKGACITQFTVVNNVNICQNRLRHGRQKSFKVIVATTLPMFHIFAGVLNTLGPITHNSRVIYSSYKYDIKAYVEAIIEHNANFVTLTPTILIDLLSHIETNNLADQIPLKVIQPGGAALSPEVVSRAFKILPNLEELRSGYGSTENGAVATFQTLHEPAESRAFTVGPPIDFTAIRIVKPKTDDIVAHGVKGEVQTRGFNTMIGYLNMPDKTAEVLTPNGWYKTGDIGLMHPHGSIQICGRIKQMIIKGGENIYPEEVEQLIHKLEFVEDAHVVGVPDKRFGEQVCAWIKLKAGFKEVKKIEEKKSDKDVHKDDILNYCKENITYFKVPKYILFVDSFPMTPTKKVQHNIMSEESIKLLKLENQV